MDYAKYNAKLKASRSRTYNAVKERLRLKMKQQQQQKIVSTPRVTTKKNNKIALIKAKLELYNATKNDKTENEKEAVMVSIATEIQNLHRKSIQVHKKKSKDDGDRDVIAKNKLAHDKALDKLYKLKNHEKNAMISLVGDAFMLNIPGTKSVYFSGLNPVLKKIFFPNEQDDPRLKDPEEVKRRRQKKNYQPSNLKKNNINNNMEMDPLVCKYSGKQHGIQVHKEIEFFTNIVATESDMYKCVEQIKDPDPCTLKFIYHFMENGWKPVLSEFKVWDSDVAMATAIDVILLDTNTWELIVVELKTGYDGESYVSLPSDSTLKKPFDELKHCPKTRHQLQLLFQKIILERKYNTNINRCYVLRASPQKNKVESYPLMKWARNKDNQKMFYDQIVLFQRNI